jgi:hypothetical membrane protein
LSTASIRAAAGTWLVGAAVYLTAEVVTATGVESYSYLDDYISELGVSGLMNRAFMLHGVLFLIGAVLVVRSVELGWTGRAFVVAAAVNALGNVGVGGFPSGTAAHVTGAGMAIIGGNVAVILGALGSRSLGAGQWFRRAGVTLGAVGLLCLAVLVIDGVNGASLPVGLVERGAVYPIIAWELLAGVTILRTRSVV